MFSKKSDTCSTCSEFKSGTDIGSSTSENLKSTPRAVAFAISFTVALY